MKKNIVIIILSLFSVMFLVYGLVQRQLAINNYEMLKLAETRAMEQEKVAQAAKTEAMQQAMIARQTAEDCNKK